MFQGILKQAMNSTVRRHFGIFGAPSVAPSVVDVHADAALEAWRVFRTNNMELGLNCLEWLPPNLHHFVVVGGGTAAVAIERGTRAQVGHLCHACAMACFYYHSVYFYR